MIPRVENRWCDASLLARATGDSRAVPHEQAAIFEEKCADEEYIYEESLFNCTGQLRYR